MESRAQPRSDVEIGHNSMIACHLANMAFRLKRRVNWDVTAERVIHDVEAQPMVMVAYRERVPDSAGQRIVGGSADTLTTRNPPYVRRPGAAAHAKPARPTRQDDGARNVLDSLFAERVEIEEKERGSKK
jgi:hypothetical protein